MIGDYGTVFTDMVVRRGQDFTHVFTLTAGQGFAVGTTADFEIYARDRETLLGFWPAASVTTTSVSVQVLAALLDAVPDGAFYTLYLQEPGHPRVAWFEGPVWRKGRA
ncbi:hypothetical protein JVX93_21825 [Mycolicibacterium boenickei]|nr:hypothetical protein JVX93_21825 [Mycolicibacterium boenickei]